MSESCCAARAPGNKSVCCPASGTPAKSVDWLTVAALTAREVPPRQNFWLCRDQKCEVVYFGEDGTQLRVDELRVQPGFKSDGEDALLCYCFLHRRRDFRQDLLENHESRTVGHIEAEIRAGNCACEVRNPTGKCCLGEIKKAVRDLGAELLSKRAL